MILSVMIFIFLLTVDAKSGQHAPTNEILGKLEALRFVLFVIAVATASG